MWNVPTFIASFCVTYGKKVYLECAESPYSREVRQRVSVSDHSVNALDLGLTEESEEIAVDQPGGLYSEQSER